MSRPHHPRTLSPHSHLILLLYDVHMTGTSRAEALKLWRQRKGGASANKAPTAKKRPAATGKPRRSGSTTRPASGSTTRSRSSAAPTKRGVATRSDRPTASSRRRLTRPSVDSKRGVDLNRRAGPAAIRRATTSTTTRRPKPVASSTRTTAAARRARRSVSSGRVDKSASQRRPSQKRKPRVPASSQPAQAGQAKRRRKQGPPKDKLLDKQGNTDRLLRLALLPSIEEALMYKQVRGCCCSCTQRALKWLEHAVTPLRMHRSTNPTRLALLLRGFLSLRNFQRQGGRLCTGLLVLDSKRYGRLVESMCAWRL